MSRSSLGDFLGDEARNAIADVRQKLFEEAWFGRVVTAAPVVEVSRDVDPEPGNRSHAFDALWGRSPEGKEQPARQMDVPQMDRDR